MHSELSYSAEERLPEAEELLSLIEERRYRAVIDRLRGVPALDIAAVFSELPEKYHPPVFRVLPKALAAEVFILIEPRMQERLIHSFTDDELSAMLDEIYLDDTVDLIEEMPATVVKRIIRNSDSRTRADINRLLNFPSDSVGSIMTTEYVRISPEMTVGGALDHIRRVAVDKETVYTSYVTDRERRLIGVISARELMISPVSAVIGDIMTTEAVYLKTTDDRSEASLKLMRYGHLALPVVDNELRLVGIVTVDDAARVISDEVEEDFAVMAAVTPSDVPYLKTGIGSLIKSRLPWLIILMVTATLSSTILSSFEAALPAVLLIFVPMLMGTGGNSGGQASVTVIRAISLGELSFRDLGRVLLKELLVGLSIGSILGVATYLKVLLVDGYLLGNGAIDRRVAFAVALALVIAVIAAKLIGALLPILSHKIGLDPAVMASPLITTLVDVIALAVYFLIAVLFVPGA